MISVRKVSDKLNEAIRFAVAYNKVNIAQSLQDLQTVLHGNLVNEYPIVWAERLMAVIQERPSDVELVLESVDNQGKADTLEEFLLDVYFYISENGTTIMDWRNTIMEIEFYNDFDLNLALIDLMHAIFGLPTIDEVDTEESANEVIPIEYPEISYSCWNCGASTLAPRCFNCHEQDQQNNAPRMEIQLNRLSSEIGNMDFCHCLMVKQIRELHCGSCSDLEEENCLSCTILWMSMIEY